jgi:uncharacterized repeat protein (TIGR03806 family)
MCSRLCTLAVVAAVLLAGCGDHASVRSFNRDAYPQRLSEWGLFELSPGRLSLANGVEPYDLNTPLFTDYAQKLRAIWMPPGTSAEYSATESFEFPVGTVIAKTFFYPQGTDGLLDASFDWPGDGRSLARAGVRLMETRLLVRQADGWDALPYVWKGDDAYLKIAGDLMMAKITLPDGSETDFPYVVPSRNQCASCHATNHTSGAIRPIGPKARHLNRAYLGRSGNQLTDMAAAGRLHGLPALPEVPANADFLDPGAPVADRARAYLDANCGHCHNAEGAADTSGLLLDAGVVTGRHLGLCKPPIAAGGGSGGRSYSIVPGAPDESILIYRVESTDPGSMMPELGRSLVHAEGVALLKDWIAGLDGACIETTTD